MRSTEPRGLCYTMCRRAGMVALAFAILLVLAILAAQSAQAQSYSVLYSFTGRNGDGSDPEGVLIGDRAGHLYGTTVLGGDRNLGTVFGLSLKTGKKRTLHRFEGFDGLEPCAGLIRDAAGNLYGTTYGDIWASVGTVFKLDPTGTLTVLHTFTGGGNGANPRGGLVRDTEGNLYGTTEYSAEGQSGCGVVFKLDTTGTATVLHSFTGGLDGCSPEGTLVRDPHTGDLYGTAYSGGLYGGGTMFKMDPTGTLTVVHSFNGADGGGPWAGLVGDVAGNLYGTTQGGGPNGSGTVFKLDPTGTFTVLHTFTLHDTEGYFPMGSLVRDATGNLYGTTWFGGDLSCSPPTGCGVVFKLDPTGTLTVLHTFTGGTDGGDPVAGLIRDSAGNLYGTAASRGDGGGGVVFKITP